MERSYGLARISGVCVSTTSVLLNPKVLILWNAVLDVCLTTIRKSPQFAHHITDQCTLTISLIFSPHSSLVPAPLPICRPNATISPSVSPSSVIPSTSLTFTHYSASADPRQPRHHRLGSRAPALHLRHPCNDHLRRAQILKPVGPNVPSRAWSVICYFVIRYDVSGLGFLSLRHKNEVTDADVVCLLYNSNGFRHIKSNESGLGPGHSTISTALGRGTWGDSYGGGIPVLRARHHLVSLFSSLLFSSCFACFLS